MSGGHIHSTVETQGFLAGDFDLSAVAEFRTPLGENRALVAGGAIRPHHGRPAVATHARAHIHRGGRIDVDNLRAG